jgi:hypothetical protein
MALAALSAGGASAAAPAVESLRLGEKDGALTLSFDIRNAFTAEIHEQLQSGTPVSFVHEIQGVRGRKWWLNGRQDIRQVVTTARFDVLTGQYQLTRELDGVVDLDWATRDLTDVIAWMSRVEDAPLGLTRAQAGGFEQIRVRSSLYERRLFAAVSWSVRTAWAQIKLALP